MVTLELISLLLLLPVASEADVGSMVVEAEHNVGGIFGFSNHEIV